MMYKITCHDDALRRMLDVVMDFVPEPTDMVFDLVDSVEADDTPVSVYQCRECDATEHYCLTEEEFWYECPRCGEIAMELAVNVAVVIQGDCVVYRRADE